MGQHLSIKGQDPPADVVRNDRLDEIAEIDENRSIHGVFLVAHLINVISEDHGVSVR